MQKHNIWRLTPIVLATLLLATASCVREEEEHTHDTNRGNMQALWTIVDQNYCFFDYKGVDWNEVGARYMARVNEQMPSYGLFQVMCEMLAELRDGHVNLSRAADVGRYWAWKDDYPDNFDTEVQERYLGRDYKIAGGLKYRLLDDNVAYVVCNSFEDDFGDGNLDYVMTSMEEATGMIVDVRDNGGGSLDLAERLASRFTNVTRLVGYTMFKTGLGHNDFSAPRPEYLDAANGYRWQKRAVVLTNRSCYSATNTFVRDMRCCPQVTVMGDTTGGGSGLPMMRELPNGWTVRLSVSPMLDALGRQIEFGIAPDIVCQMDTAQAHQGIDTIIESARRLLKREGI